MNLRQAYLLTCAVGVALLALSYGAMPVQSMKLLFNIDVVDINTRHILRAVMGLYLAMALFWVIGAWRAELRQAALYSQIVFVAGLGAGRVVSLLVDGMPHPLLVTYLAVEVLFTGLTWVLLGRAD
jgi:predicted membrane protein